MNRLNKGFAMAFAALAVLGAGIVGCLGGWHAREATLHDGSAGDSTASRTLQVVVACDGWTQENVGLGAFVSGHPSDGASFDEQLTFAGSGSQELTVPAGAYQVVPRTPRIMLADGTVLAASEPATCWCADDAPNAATLAYLPVDMAYLADEELVAVACDSFVEESNADRAVELARAIRDSIEEDGGEDEIRSS